MPESYGGQWEAPRMVILGINPGEADLTFQGRDGIFAGEIAELGSYSAWAATDRYHLPTAQSLLGHANVDTTASTYVDAPGLDELAESVDGFAYRGYTPPAPPQSR